MDISIGLLRARAESVLNRGAMGTEGTYGAVEAVISEIKTVVSEAPGAGAALGALMAELHAARKSRAVLADLRWVNVGEGRMAIGHRPDKKAIKAFKQFGVTHIVTLLSGPEGAMDIGSAARRAGIDWIWFPMRSASRPDAQRLPEIEILFEKLKMTLAAGGSIFIHCSAGIHRTGMITYGMLRSFGLSKDDANTCLRSLRPETAEGLGESRLSFRSAAK